MWNTLVSIFPYAIAYTIPMLMTSLGGLYSERSGVT
ncbi:MAG: ABC transporter permease, partial [Sphaerochaeta sp.]